MPWQFWIIPLFWWSAFYVAIFVVGASLMVILRKQWVVHERIDFPLMELPLAILESPEEGGFFRIPVLNRPVFWLGFVPPLFIIFWNMISLACDNHVPGNLEVFYLVDSTFDAL